MIIGTLFFLVFLFVVWFVAQFVIDRLFPQNRTDTKLDFSVSNSVTVMVGISLLAYNFFLYDTSMGPSIPTLGLSLATVSILIGLLLSNRRNRTSRLAWIITVVGVAASVGLVTRASGFVQSVDSVVMIFSMVFLWFLATVDRMVWHSLWLIRQPVFMITHLFKHLISLRKNVVLHTGPHQNALVTWLKTVGITLLVLIVFTGLLSAADPVFNQLVETFRDQLVGRTVGTLIVSLLVFLVLTLRLLVTTDKEPTVSWFSVKDMVIPVGSLVVLFAVFLMVQAKYLFGSHVDLAQFGFTYSEYVRKGFVELLWTALLGGIIAHLTILKQADVPAGKKKNLSKLLTGLIVIELFLLLVSALKRDMMYVEVYGLTRVRVVGELFLAWLAGLLTLLFVRNIYSRIKDGVFLAGVGILSVLVIVSLNALDIDKMVVAGSPSHHDYKDYFYVNNLSEDAVAGWIQSLPVLENGITALLQKDQLTDIELSKLAGDKLALISLKEKLDTLNLRYGSEAVALAYCKTNGCLERDERDTKNELNKQTKQMRNWQYINFSSLHAYRILESQQSSMVATIDRLTTQIHTWQVKNNVDLYTQEYRLLFDFKYPFISIRLKYYPQQGIQFTSPSMTGERFEQAQIGFMMQNPTTTASLSAASCGMGAKQIVLTGMIRPSAKAFELSGQSVMWYDLWDNSALSETQSILVAVNADFDLEKGRHFGRATLTSASVTDASGCHPYYTLDSWKELVQIQ